VTVFVICSSLIPQYRYTKSFSASGIQLLSSVLLQHCCIRLLFTSLTQQALHINFTLRSSISAIRKPPRTLWTPPKIFPGEGDVLQHRQKARVPNFALMANPLYEYVDCHFTFLSRDRMNNHPLFRSLSPANISPAQLAAHLGKKRKGSSNSRPSPTRHAKCELMTASTASTTALTTMRTNSCSSYTSNRSKYSIKSLAFFPLYRHRPQQLRCSWNPS